MWMWIGIGAGVPAGVAVLWGLFILVVIRTGYRPGLAVVRRFNRRFTNRHAMKTAGAPGATASVIRHIGRSSGAAYETPIGITEADDHFLISLPYGPDTDWLKNVLKAGGAEVSHEGSRYRVIEPELVEAAAVGRFLSRSELRLLRVFGVDQVLRVRRSALEEGAAGRA